MPALSSGQCIVINEILINGASSFDGQGAPNTEEWVELYNTCSTPVDISCWALADGDFVVRFPQGTIMPGNSHFVIGSANSIVPIDLNVATCGCGSPNSQLIIFTNGNEQLALINSAGVIEDAVIWGGGQSLPFTVNNSNAGCPAINTQVSAATAQFEPLPLVTGSSGEGCTYARTCDGSNTWEMRCGSAITAGDTNGAPGTIDFDALQSQLCINDCTNFLELCEGDILTYAWTFEGASPGTSSSANPANICYAASGTYDVSLTITTSCGTLSQTVSDFISVTDNAIPVISGGENSPYCEGESVVLTTNVSGNLQWYRSDIPIPGATGDQFTATLPGDYTVSASGSSCGGTSAAVTLQFDPALQIAISADGPTTLCPGGSVILSTVSPGPYQWLNGTDPIPGATSSSLTVSTVGNYSLSSPGGDCMADSDPISVSVVNEQEPLISSSANSYSICPDESIELSVNGTYDNYTWYFEDAVIPGATSVSLDADQVGSYYAEVQTGGCTFTSVTVEITAGAVPTIHLTPEPQIQMCPGGTEWINATGDFTGIDWYQGVSVIANNVDQISVEDEGTYSAMVFSADGCETLSNTVTLSFHTLPPFSIESSEGLALCPGETTDLTATPGYDNYAWTSGGGPVGSDSNVLDDVSQGVFQVTATSPEGCDISASITIQPAQLPDVDITPGGIIETCEDSFILTATGATNYNWYFEGEPVAFNTSQFTAVDPGDYTVEGFSGNCSAMSNITTVHFIEGATVEITASADRACEGESILLSVPPVFQQYAWNTGSNTPGTTVTTTGIYTVEVTAANGCRSVAEREIIFDPNPVITLESTFESDCVLGAEVIAHSTGLISWELSPYITLTDNNLALVNPPSTTTFYISSTIENCITEREFTVFAQCATIFIPNVFTPNGDGVNDFFRIEGENIGHFEMIIFNRWGDELYRTNDINRGWNGSVNAYFAPDGTYNYIIKALDPRGNPVLKDGTFYGTVTLLR